MPLHIFQYCGCGDRLAVRWPCWGGKAAGGEALVALFLSYGVTLLQCMVVSLQVCRLGTWPVCQQHAAAD
jgi:hypothetical protein